MTGSTFNGFVAPPPTPMAADGNLRLEAVEAQAAALAANGIVGAFICGTTGEGVSLTVEERMAVAERWRRAAPKGFRLIVQVGALAAADAEALAAHAERIGADAVASLPPLYFKPACMDELVGWCAGIAAAAPSLGFYYYHIPAMSGVTWPLSELLAAAEGIPNLAGAKFTHEDLMDLRLCLAAAGGRFELFFGRDEMLLAALATGARQAIGTTYNFAAPLYRRIVAAFEAGDLEAARADQGRAGELVGVLRRHGGVRAVKPIMKMLGQDLGPPRPPLRGLSAADCDALRGELERIGFFDYCSKGA